MGLIYLHPLHLAKVARLPTILGVHTMPLPVPSLSPRSILLLARTSIQMMRCVTGTRRPGLKLISTSREKAVAESVLMKRQRLVKVAVDDRMTTLQGPDAGNRVDRMSTGTFRVETGAGVALTTVLVAMTGKRIARGSMSERCHVISFSCLFSCFFFFLGHKMCHGFFLANRFSLLPSFFSSLLRQHPRFI